MFKIDRCLINFANNLKLLRDEKMLSIRDLAAELGISKSAINQYENCQAEPTLSTVCKIAEFFDVDIDWLIGLKQNRR